LLVHNHARLWIGAAVLLVAAVGVASALLPSSLALTAISDIAGALLMLSALVASARNGFKSQGRIRLFWMLQSAGWGLWLSDQLVWVAFDLILQKKMPAMYPADALLFLSGAPMLAGLLLRPHLQPSERSTRQGVLDFLLLMLWWFYVYATFVMCWQYVSPNEALYNRNFDVFSAIGTLVLTTVLIFFWRQSSGRWRMFYAYFCAAVVFNGITFYILNRALERNVYYTGSWYDLPYWASFAIFTAVALHGDGLSPQKEVPANDAYSLWVANLAMTAVLSLPVLAVSSLLDDRIPSQAARFRVLVTLATMFLMAFLLFVKHYRLYQELKRTNNVLEEASLTDPLTGLRNRRYFSATIEADVSHTLRSYADSHDPHTRDLVFYLIDADDFKEVNDRYGHDAGDKVLLEMARRLGSSIRHSDVLVRWGGEEFLIVSRYTDRSEAELLATRVLSAIADTPFQVTNPDEAIFRTCSLGWAAFPWLTQDPNAVDYEQVLSMADRGLNRAKRMGKNRAVGILPAAGRLAPTTIEGGYSKDLQVDVMAIAGPSHPTALSQPITYE
jgi:diguanylate cyclase (GGDEF)-like protein